VAIGGVLIWTGHRITNVWAVVGLALAGAVAERGRVSLGSNTSGSISLLPTVFAAAVFGPLAAMLVSAASLLDLLRRPYLKWGIYTSIRALYGAMAGLAAVAALRLVGSDVGGLVAASAAAACIAEPLDVALAALTFKLRGGSARDSIRASAPVVLASIPLYTPVVALLAIAYTQLSPWTLPLFFAPALAAQRLFALYQEQRRLAEDLASVNTQLERANMSFATALVATLDARDRYTAGHSAAVAIYARDIAERMGLAEDQKQLAHLCGLVHDIGKIGLPAGLLEKPGALTLEERRQMEQHSPIGERILAKVDDYAEIASIVRHHHERMDGHGYPDGLTDKDIPLLSRIIAVADAYNAMTSDRPYRDAMPSRVARLRLAQAVETQFDTTVVAAFEAILAGASETYRSGSRPDFSLEAQDPYISAPALSA
jgi:putative nucleotidyltransferase with HDIG domain